LSLIGLGVLVAQLIAKPIFELVSATQKVSDGNFNSKVTIYGDDEIGSLTRGFNHMVDELKQREFIHEIFGRMVSTEVREAVLTGQISLGGETRSVTVLFTDIRGFTSMAENTSPQEVIGVLNDYFKVIARATKKHGGLINRFGGDSALIVFGAPIKRPLFESLQQAIFAAIDIRIGVAELNAQRLSIEKEAIRFGIGINSGTVVAGNLGSEDRFEYTVIGDAVNVAARLQGLTRDFPETPLLITGSSIKPVRDRLNINFKDLGKFKLRGKSAPVSVFSILEPTEALPLSFELFDAIPHPRINGVIACHLFCIGFEPQIIANTLDIDLDVVLRWILIAQQNPEIVRPILVDTTGTPIEKTHRLIQAKES
jgi:class 3 adenylate cyclase